MIKILAGQTHYLGTDGKTRLSAVDWWRLINPLSKLEKKYKDISVDIIQRIVDKNGNEETAWNKIGKKYDIFYTSYIDTPKAYSFIKAITEKHNIKHIMDMDDNIFEVDKMNPVYLRYYPGSESLKNATIIAKDSQYMTASTPHLANTLNALRGKNDVEVLPNYIDPETYTYNSELANREFDKRKIIGYQGSSTHYSDLFNSGVLEAISKLMKEYDNLYFYVIGMGTEDLYNYLPKDRVIIEGGERDHRNWVKKWQSLPIDIGIAPLINTKFNKSKSSIKYYEYALRKIPAVYSFSEPYSWKVIEGKTGYLASNTLEWYNKLKRLIDDPILKEKIAKKAREDVLENYVIDNHLEKIYNYIKKVHNDK